MDYESLNKKQNKANYLKMGNKMQITLTINPGMLEEINALAKRRGMARAATIILAISEHLERERSRSIVPSDPVVIARTRF